MAGVADVTRLNREIDELEERVGAALRAKVPGIERRSLRAEIERCMQRLDELRNRLGG
jgi:hypothetical protein